MVEWADLLEVFLPPGSVFGRYIIHRQVGRGGAGAVYEATHSELKKRVALKTLHPMMAASSEVRSRFRREGELAARIHHPNVVDIYDVGEERGLPYLVMEFLDGEDLGHHLERMGPLDPVRIADLLLPVVCALDVAHRAGVVHRDLKPSNLFLALGNHGDIAPKIVDFGISTVVGDESTHRITSAGIVLGTPYYMSPEQAGSGEMVDARSDQYSLAAIAYQCATGERPFVDSSTYGILRKIVDGEFRRPSDLAPGIPPGFEAAILKAMAGHPEDRHETILDLGRALLPFASRRVEALVEPALGGASDAYTGTTPHEGEDAPASSWPPAETFGAVPRAGSERGTVHSVARGIGAVVLMICGVLGLVQYGSPSALEIAPVLEPARPIAGGVEPSEGSETFRTRVEASPGHATFELDGSAVGVGAFEATLRRDGTPHVLVVSAEGYRRRTLTFVDAPPAPRVELRPSPQYELRPTPPARPTGEPRAARAAKPRRGTNEALILH